MLLPREAVQSPNSTPAREGPSQAGNNPSTQAGRQAVTQAAGRQLGAHLGAGPPGFPREQCYPKASSTSFQEGTQPPTPNRLPQRSSLEDPNPKWVISLSSKLLTQAQRSVLAKGPNFWYPLITLPNLEYITAIAAACTKLSQQDAEELRADINKVLISAHSPQTQSH